MTLHYKAIHTQIHRVLAQRGYQFPFASNMARITEDRQLRFSLFEFHWNMPHR